MFWSKIRAFLKFAMDNITTFFVLYNISKCHCLLPKLNKELLETFQSFS